MRFFSALILGAVLSTGLLGQAESVVQRSEKSIAALISESGQFTKLIAAVDRAGIRDLVDAEGPVTVFAPSDRAFDMLPEGELEKIMGNEDLLLNTLAYHALFGEKTLPEMALMGSVEMLNGQKVTVTQDQAGFYINDALVTMEPILAKNGVLYVIDRVLLPK